jgi:hypothetical protein
MAENTTARAWKATRDSLAGVFIDDQKAILAGSNKNFVVADSKGITIKGPLSLASMSNEQRSGGLFIGQGDFRDMIPATIVTINPRKLPIPPITGIINVVADIAFFAAFLV